MNTQAVASVRDAKTRYENAVKYKSMVRQRKEEYINILLSNAGELLAIADEFDGLQEQLGLEIQENMKLAAKLKAAGSEKAAEADKAAEAPEEIKPGGRKAK